MKPAARKRWDMVPPLLLQGPVLPNQRKVSFNRCKTLKMKMLASVWAHVWGTSHSSVAGAACTCSVSHRSFANISSAEVWTRGFYITVASGCYHCSAEMWSLIKPWNSILPLSSSLPLVSTDLRSQYSEVCRRPWKLEAIIVIFNEIWDFHLIGFNAEGFRKTQNIMRFVIKTWELAVALL